MNSQIIFFAIRYGPVGFGMATNKDEYQEHFIKPLRMAFSEREHPETTLTGFEFHNFTLFVVLSLFTVVSSNVGRILSNCIGATQVEKERSTNHVKFMKCHMQGSPTC